MDFLEAGLKVQKIRTFLMFDGRAEEAMKYYTSLFERSEIGSISYYGPNEEGQEGSVHMATFTLKGQELQKMK
jgi:predicted 3-demethylubiquinone-9 3-methyltransferase (glyoxalase superfamily)